MKQKRPRYQKPVKGGRPRVSAAVEEETDKRLKWTARKYGVSRSFVQAVFLAEALGVKVERFVVEEEDRPRLRRVK